MKNNNLPQVNIRNGFSDRNRIKCQSVKIQIDDFDDITRMNIFNEINRFFDRFKKNNGEFLFDQFFRNLINDSLLKVFHQEINYGIERYNKEWYVQNYIKPTILENDYSSFLDYLEYLIKFIDFDYVYNEFNDIFEQNYVGYRFVNKQIVPITDEMEIEEIEKAVDENPFDNSKKLLQEALNKLSDRNNKDFAGCIHKSISAVESVCQSLLGEQKSLGDALKKLEENGIKINGALKSAFSTLYGWTSDNGNIRHANIKNSDNPTFDEAKFMVVACSAFINYLISKKASLGGGNAN